MSKTRQRLAKVRWGCLLWLFGCFSLVCGWFWRGGWHFRTARSGVYMGAGLTDSVIRFGFLVEWMDAHFRYYLTAPPERSLSRRSETAGEVWKGLGFGVHPLRLQKTASLLHPLSRIAEFCFRPLLRLRLGASVFFATRLRLTCIG